MSKKHLLKVIGDTLSYAIVINFYIWLLVAMLSDGVVKVYFNFYGEGLVEYLIYITIFPIITYSVFIDIRAYRRKKKEKYHEQST